MAGYFLRLTPEELAKAREKLRRRRLPPVILSPSEIQSARLRVKGLGPRIPAPSHELRAIRMKMLELINHDRREYPEESRQAHPLVWHEGVAHVTQEHSEDMLRRKFMAHENPEGLGPGDRLLAAGIRFV